jgi:hypothetical protein
MSPATFLFGIFIGILISAPITYILTSRQIVAERTKSAVQTAVEDVKKQLFTLQGKIEGQNTAFSDFKPERVVFQTNEGIFRKRFYVTLKERLVYKGTFPLPWWETKTLVGEKLDEASLEAFAKAASVIAKAIDLKSLGMELITTVLNRQSTSNVLDRQPLNSGQASNFGETKGK